MTEALGRRIWLLAFILLCGASTMLEGWKMRDWSNALSPVDPSSEANALREVDGFRAQGLAHDAGLGNVLFGTRYPDQGFPTTFGEERARSVTPSGIYTHYPPGPEYLLYVAEMAFGPEPVSRLRLVPLALCGTAAVFFGLSVRRRFGAIVGWLVMLACLAVVPFHDANSSVHFLGYALALLLVEIGVAVGRDRSRVPFLLLGFAQGWLSFDYVFLVVFVPMAVELSLPYICPEHRARLRLALGRCVLAGMGFVLAHLLHFGEVWAFYGSLGDALADLQSSARYRAGIDQAKSTVDYIDTGLALIYYYVVSPYPISVPFWHPAPKFYAVHAFRFLGLTLGVWWLLAAAVMCLVDVRQWLRGLRPLRLLRRWYAIGLIGLGVSCVWWLVMQNHSIVHVHLLYRQMTVCFVLWVIFLAVQLEAPIERWWATYGARFCSQLRVKNWVGRPACYLQVFEAARYRAGRPDVHAERERLGLV
jgi:hypothetical protein